MTISFLCVIVTAPEVCFHDNVKDDESELDSRKGEEDCLANTVEYVRKRLVL